MKNFLLLGLLFASSILYSQTTPSYKIDSIPEINITGTSTLHNWTVVAGEVTDFPENLSITIEEGQTIDSFAFKVSVASLDGGRGPSMNGKIQKALKATTAPMIVYQQTAPALITQKEEVWMLQSTGNLTLAGVQKELSVQVLLEKEENQLVFKGSTPLKMSEFGMTPPSAMFGQIQTHDDIAVHFVFRYVIMQ